MKRTLWIILLCLTTNIAHADWGRWHGDGGWFLPALLGGAALGYVAAQPRTVYVQPQPVIYTQPQVIVQTPAPPVVQQGNYAVPAPRPRYQTVMEYNAQCNCNVAVQRQVGWQ